MTANETLEEIKTNCHNYFNLSIDVFSEKARKLRKKEYIRVRRFIYFIACEVFNFDMRDISNHFNVDYQSVTGGIRNFRYSITYDKKLMQDFNNLRSMSLSSERVRTRIENIVYDEIMRQLPNLKSPVVERIAFLTNIQIMKLLT